MREGELLGLRWQAVDLDAGTLSVRYGLKRHPGQGATLEETKSTRSRRPLLLTTQAVEALRRQRARQREERLAVGPAWEDGGYVITNERGKPLVGSSVWRHHQRLLARLGLPAVRFHDLRHTSISLLLEQGMAPQLVMAYVGHASIGITVDTYGNLSAASLRQVADALDRLFAPEAADGEAARG
jgi:integrase